MKYRVLTTLIFCIGIQLRISAAIINTDTANSAQTAVNFYNNGQYVQALNLFEGLLKKYPKDFLYNYYTGICLLKTKKDIPRAVEYLRYASTKLVPDDVYFYLGQAYQLNYEFSNAIAVYDQYLSKLPVTAKLKKEEAEYSKQTAFNSRKEVQQIKQTTLLTEDSLNVNGLPIYLNKILTTGKFILKPDELNNSYRAQDEAFPYMFVRNKRGTDDLVYFSGYDKNKNKNSEILSSSEILSNIWQTPTNLGYIINTTYNECYAYFDYKKHILYFSSDCSNGMGGYDIYYSSYNSITKTWSSPVNMGFPINTPYDDFMLIPSETEDNSFYFCSNRSNSGALFKLYKISQTGSIIDNSENTFSAKELLNVSLFIPGINRTENTSMSYTNSTNINEKTTINGTEKWSSIKSEDEYNILISDALNYQLRADSASRAIFDHQQELQNSSIDSKTKTAIYQDINKLTNQKKENQQEADRLFALARQYEQQNYNTSKQTFQTNYQNSSIEEKKNSIEIIEVETDGKSTNEKVNEFKIYNRTIYSEKNPIPKNFKPLDGLMYSIQLGAFSKPLANDYFGGISPIFSEFVSEKSITKYYAGQFNNFQLASQALQQIKSAGYTDAYIVSYMEGNKISVNRAIEIEKEISGK